MQCAECPYAEAPWAASTARSVGSMVRPTTYNGFRYKCTVAGTSDLFEPAWPVVQGATVIDGTAVWETVLPGPKLCAYVDDPGNPGFPKARPLPTNDRGFDDPQADPLPGTLIQTNVIRYRRADLYSYPAPPFGGGSPPAATTFPFYANDPPWGSKPSVPDNDADGVPDCTAPCVSPILDRKNQGAYAAIFERDRPQQDQQFPQDAFAELSCPYSPPGPCNVYTQDCGGMAKNLTDGPAGYVPYPGASPLPPPSSTDWARIPFPRDWVGSDAPSAPAIKRLLRFASSIVRYDSLAPHMQEYSLAEDSRNVAITSPGTPLAGVLRDVYKYLKNSAFPTPGDPFVNCRPWRIVFVTDGLEECFGTACAGAGPGSEAGNTGVYPNGGPSKDLGLIQLPDSLNSPPGSPTNPRAIANAIDPSIQVTGVPVFVVGLGLDASFPGFKCIADNTGGVVYAASNRAGLVTALKSILDLKKGANFFAAPAVPAFASGFGDSAQIGAVIPSHVNVDNSGSRWAIWNGALKSYKLDAKGLIPVVTGSPPPTNTPTPGGPTPIPATPTPTGAPTPPVAFPDESDPNNAAPSSAKPIWNAARVLGYTDPVGNLTDNLVPAPASPAAKAPAIKVWPGRRMVWADPASLNVPLLRKDFVPNTGACTGAGTPLTCFDDLMNLMGLTPTTDVPKQTLAIQTVQFLRGGKTAFGSRDEILNDISYGGGNVGPGSGQQQDLSYFYQDDIPPPGALSSPPQVRTDGAAPAPFGYAHKLGDIFHSEPLLLEPPRYFQYLSRNLNPSSPVVAAKAYSAFASQQSKRRKVIFVGSNDGFLHAFDGGVWNRDSSGPFANTFDLGTGREIFAYAPRSIMLGFPNLLLQYPPQAQYFVDGSMGFADVFIDNKQTGGLIDPANRDWRTVLVGTLRQGGRSIYALDVTQPDQIDASGQKLVGTFDNSPDCLDGTPGPCPAKYPTVLWERTDDCAVDLLTCATITTANPTPQPTIGETWSKPVVGRIKIINGVSFEDRYVAIFGGGNDPSFRPLDPICPPTCGAAGPTIGRAIYMMDLETGKILYKATQGKDGGGATVLFAPMPASPAVVDFNDDGYLDIVWIGDVNGRMWRLDITPDITTTPKRGDLVAGVLQGYQPFLLYDASTLTAAPAAPNQPIYLQAAAIFLGGGGARPTFGVGFGTGNRGDLSLSNPVGNNNRFFYVIDDGSGTTLHEADLKNITPAGPATAGTRGFRLDFQTGNEKAVSTVFSTRGFLTLVSFTPDSTNPCATEGSSYRYSFFFLTGKGGYAGRPGVLPGTYGEYREKLGAGLAAASQSTSPQGDTIDTTLFLGGGITQVPAGGTLSTINQNWMERRDQ